MCADDTGYSVGGGAVQGRVRLVPSLDFYRMTSRSTVFRGIRSPFVTPTSPMYVRQRKKSVVYL